MMQVYQDEAFILKSITMREADRVLTLLSRDQGKYKAVAHGVDKPSSRKRGALQPFTYSKLLVRKGRTLHTVEQCEGIYFFSQIKESLEGLSYAAYFAELVDAILPEWESIPGILSLLLETLKQWQDDVAYHIVRAFELKLLCLTGYCPHLNGCVLCGKQELAPRMLFIPALGGLVCEACGKEQEQISFVSLSQGSVAILRLLLHWPMDRFFRLKIDEKKKKEIQMALRGFLQYYLESNLKTTRFLDWLERKF